MKKVLKSNRKFKFSNYLCALDVTGRKNLLITTGDSWTFGDGGIPDEMLTEEINRDRCEYFRQCAPWSYPAYLADMLGGSWDLINSSMAGGSNESSTELTRMFLADVDLDAYQNVILMYGFVTGNRHFYMSDQNSNKWESLGITHRGTGYERLTHKMGEDYIKFASDELLIERVVREIYNIQLTCKVLGIKCLIWNPWYAGFRQDLKDSEVFGHYEKLLDWDMFADDSVYETYDHMLKDEEKKTGKKLFKPCHHPSHEGYWLVAKQLLRELTQKKYI